MSLLWNQTCRTSGNAVLPYNVSCSIQRRNKWTHTGTHQQKNYCLLKKRGLKSAWKTPSYILENSDKLLQLLKDQNNLFDWKWQDVYCTAQDALDTTCQQTADYQTISVAAKSSVSQSWAGDYLCFKYANVVPGSFLTSMTVSRNLWTYSSCGNQYKDF